jgi:feruloyl-CoA synthase
MSFFDNPGMLAPPRVTRIDLSRGGFILACSDPLEEVTRCIGDWLEYWAARTPNALFLAERDAEGEWVRMTYAQVREQVGKLAQGLLDLGIGPTAPVVCLSDNSLDQALLTLATMHIGRPFATVSSAYSRLAKDYSKVATILQELAPGAVYAGDGAVYASAIRASAVSCPVILSTNAYQLDGSLSLAELMRTRETPAVMAEFAKITPETHAKYLLTSGSTGRPKIAINTHRMLCANQKQIQQSWPFLKEEKPVIVSWLPWSHTFGANHNFNLVLCNGGSFYIDEGRPVPGLMEKSVRNLREVQPNLYFNVPRGFDALIAFLEQDESFARDFFGRLRAVFYAAAALPQSTWDRLEKSAQKVLGEKVWFTSAWGATEASPLLTNVHWRLDGPGCIGLPVAGTSIKFLPNGDKLEMRVKGPQVFPGYLNNPEKTAEAFDEDGYYKIGDAGLADRPGPAGEGHRLQRAGGRGLQAHHRHLGVGGHPAGSRRHGPGALCPGRGGHRPRPGRGGPAGLPGSGRQGRAGRAAPCPRSRGAAQAQGGGRRRIVPEPDPGHAARRAAEHGRGRDHRQGLHQPAGGAGPPGR